jgi:predicted nucleic acid-binding protein
LITPSIVVLDANVLIPNALCDLLLRLAEEDVFRPRWSDDILDEVRRNLPQVDPRAIDHRIRCMNAAFDDALVDDFHHLIAEMTNHPKDRHVLAAAVVADADRIITCNLKDFPRAACERYGVEVEHPDDFLIGVWARDARGVTQVIREQAAATGRHGPLMSSLDVLDYLALAGATRFAEIARTVLKTDFTIGLDGPG